MCLIVTAGTITAHAISYCGTAASNYNEADKAMLKKFYRTLSKAFHPDSNPDKDTSEEMKMLNRLKSDWGV